MHNIDLRDFAVHAVKIPSPLLQRRPETKEVSTVKLFTAHTLDFFLVLTATVCIAFLLNQSAQGFLPSHKLVKAFRLRGQLPAATIFPLILFSYFFFTNFFNHGQSYGLHTLKLRLRMDEKDFAQSFKQAGWSSLFCLSAGLITPYFKQHVSVAQHDWLYQDLITEKDEVSFNLLEAVANHEQETESEEAFTLAA